MKASSKSSRLALFLLALSPCAIGSVGQVTVLEGSGTRTPKEGPAVPLAVGTQIELGDRIRVGHPGGVKLVLNDQSVLMIGPASELSIDEASFESLERRRFSAKLWFGKVWAKVTKAVLGSEAKFEVTTDRAVAGVRGTVFRVDSVQLVGGTKPKAAHTVVKVTEGKVDVEAMVKKSAEAAAAQTGKKKQRVQVQGPTEISAEEYEKKIAQLQANQQISIGEDLWQQAAYDPGSDNDSLGKFVKRHP